MSPSMEAIPTRSSFGDIPRGRLTSPTTCPTRRPAFRSCRLRPRPRRMRAEQAAKSDKKARHGHKQAAPQAAAAPQEATPAYPKVGPGSEPQIAGAILTSGFYDLGDKVSIWKDYYGDDVSQYPARSSLPGLLQTSTPLFVTYAELDPANFQPDSVKLIQARAKEGKPVRSLRLAGHSHISETYAVGSGDESLSAPVLDFIHSVDSGGVSK